MQLAELAWPRVEALDPNTPVVIPIAAVEQHGAHLPVFTDSMLLGEVLRRVSPQFQDRVLFAPLTWLGNSDHHMDFPGTLSAAPRLYLDLLNNLAGNFLTHGFRRILFLNGHGGNIIPGKQAAFELRQRHRDRADLLLLFASYWDFGAPLDGTDLEFIQKRVGHACEWETSMVLRIAPHLVGPLDSLGTIDAVEGFQPAHRAWITKDRSRTGHIGAPQFASADKGEHLFAAFAAGVSQFLERMIAWNGETWDG
jgi:creatinine amidohydrolase